MNVTPVGDKLLLKLPQEQEKKTENGLFIPQTVKEEKTLGEVVAVGELKSDIKVGDTVLFGEYAGASVSIDGELYLIIQESEIIAVLH